MTKKLTLSLKEETVQRAERISKNRGKTINELVEEYLNSIPENEVTQETAVDKIKKIIKGNLSNPLTDWKEANASHLTRKYGL
ncbi:MAG: DUF6364 family protein [Segetibacter sp.]